MPAKDIYHNTVKNALIKDGWTITADPYNLKWGKDDLYVDIAAEKLIVAQKDEKKIAVEVKSFIGRSKMLDFQQAVGQFIVYRNLIKLKEPNRILFLAVSIDVFNNMFETDEGKMILQNEKIEVIAFNPEHEEIVLWKE